MSTGEGLGVSQADPSRSLGQQLAFTQGRPSGFDYLRLGLSISVVAMHSVRTTAGMHADAELFNTPLRPFIRAILPMFFALSGFLVAGSLERCRTMISFAGLRVIRIFPALVVEVLLSALIIGLSVTTLPRQQYLGSPVFHRYFLNMLGDIHFYLPGVFASNPDNGMVNVQLWTIPYELRCYVYLIGLALIGVVRRPIIAPIAAALICVYTFARRVVHHHDPAFYGNVAGILLVVSFLCGISLYLYRERVPWNAPLAAAAAVASLVLTSFVPHGEFVGVVTLSYLTVWLGLSNPRRLWVIRGADLSYGVYLYGYVIQQLFSFLFPQLRVWWLSILVCVPCALAFAAASWNLVEKPALRLRKAVYRLETTVAPFLPRIPFQRDVRPQDAAAARPNL